MKTFAIIVAALLMTSAANAAQSSSSTSTQPQTGAPSAKVAAQIRSNLESAGFKDIKLMPSSFLVRAEDKDGNPVMMVINPDSVTAIKEVQPNQTTGQSQGGTSGSAQSSNSNNPSQSSK